MSFLIIMVLLLVVMYVLMIRPQRQRQAQQQAMITGASVGDDVLTTGGIYGTVTEADGDDVVVEIAQGLQVHMTRRGIAAVLPPEADDDPDIVDGEVLDTDESDEIDDADEIDEAAVTEGVEPVTSEGSVEPTAGDRG